MKTVKFLRDTDPAREGGDGFKAGDVVTMLDSSADRWITMNAAMVHEDPSEQDRLAAEKDEQDRLAAEKDEQDRLAAEKAEQDRLAAEKAEQAETRTRAPATKTVRR